MFAITPGGFSLVGRPLRLLSGALHYFRVLPEQWPHRLRTPRAMGLNTVETYVPWNPHEPRPGGHDFEGIADLDRSCTPRVRRGCARSCARRRTSAPSGTTAGCRGGCSPTRRCGHCAAGTRPTSRTWTAGTTGSFPSWSRTRSRGAATC